MSTNLDEATYWQILRRVADRANVELRKLAPGDHIVHSYGEIKRYYRVLEVTYAAYNMDKSGKVTMQREPAMTVQDMQTGVRQNLVRFMPGGRWRMGIGGGSGIEMPSAEPFCYAAWQWERRTLFGAEGRFSVTKTGDIVRKMQPAELTMLIDGLRKELREIRENAEREMRAQEERLRTQTETAQATIDELERALAANVAE